MQVSNLDLPVIPVRPVASQRSDIILLHGLFGTLSNWEKTVTRLSARNRVFVPALPLFESFRSPDQLSGLVAFLEDYIAGNDIQPPVLMGNSLGGHVALLYTLKYPHHVSKLVLAGSSGLYENSFGGSFPRIRDYRYIQEKVEDVFEQKSAVDQQMVEHVYNIVQHKSKVLSVIGLARAAQQQNLKDSLYRITVPVLLVWGLQDRVTPPEVAEQFKTLLPNAKLHYLNNCGHVPMMEHPDLFNDLVTLFLEDPRNEY